MNKQIMKKNKIILSSGSIPWYGLREILNYIKKIDYDGIEIVPTKKIISDIKHKVKIEKTKYIQSIHQNWRLDMKHDKEYGIGFPTSLFFQLIRLKFFPKIRESNVYIEVLSKNLNIPVTVHSLSSEWTKDNQNKEFLGGIQYEIIGTSLKPKNLNTWMRNKNHNIVLDLRDDQSLMWASKYGLGKWKKFWSWIGFKKIKSLQLTFMGMHGFKKIINHKRSLPEEQLLWLHEKAWKGHIIVEANPLILLILNLGNMKKGFVTIREFINCTLIKGKKWA